VLNLLLELLFPALKLFWLNCRLSHEILYKIA
jgi:hypothetical protein